MDVFVHIREEHVVFHSLKQMLKVKMLRSY